MSGSTDESLYFSEVPCGSGRYVDLGPNDGIEFIQKNPKVPHSGAFREYELYKGAKSISEMVAILSSHGIKRGRIRAHLQNDLSRGYAKLHNFQPYKLDSSRSQAKTKSRAEAAVLTDAAAIAKAEAKEFKAKLPSESWASADLPKGTQYALLAAARPPDLLVELLGSEGAAAFSSSGDQELAASDDAAAGPKKKKRRQGESALAATATPDLPAAAAAAGHGNEVAVDDTRIKAFETMLSQKLALGSEIADRIATEVLRRARAGKPCGNGLAAISLEAARELLLRCGGGKALERVECSG